MSKPISKALAARNSLCAATFALLLTTTQLCNADVPAKRLSQYSMRVYQIEQGLPHNEVRSVAQTPDGFLWFGTRNGLARFDGVEFRLFFKETTAGFGSNILGALMVDRHGTLWIATADGLSAYAGGIFTRYTTRDGLPGDAIHTLLEDRDGILWVGTWHGLAAFDGSRFRAFTEADGLPSNSISSIADDGEHGLWIGTYGGGLVHRRNDKFEVFTEKDGLSSNVMKTLLFDRQQRLWIGTSQGTARWVGGRFEVIPELPGNAWSVLQDQHDSIWVATDRTLARLTTGDDRFVAEEDWSNHKIQTLFEDREGSLWIGSIGDGVARLREAAFLTYTTKDGLVDDSSESLFEDAEHNLWIGAEGGLSRLLPDGKLEVIAGPRSPRGLEVRAIAEDEDGRIWVGTQTGVALFDGRTWRSLTGHGQTPTDVHTIYRDHFNRMWIGSPQGIAVWDHGEVSTMTEREGLPSTHVTAILEDSRARVWVGTANGLARIENGRITKVYGKTQDLQTEYVQTLYMDSNESLWISTPGGLYRLKNERIDAFLHKNGMLSDSVQHVLEDDQQRLWISSPQGIYRVAKKDLDEFGRGHLSSIPYTAYGLDDGVTNAGCNCLGVQQAGLRMHDGSLWFPTYRGVLAANPNVVPPTVRPPVPQIESIVVDGQPLSSQAMGANAKRMEISFGVPTTIAASAIEYRYRMDGFENQWNEIGQQRVTSFTNLPHGNFRFIVSARRPGGTWSTEEAKLPISVLPHFYQTWWFYIASFLVVCVSIWLIRAQYTKRFEARFHLIMTERGRLAQELHDTMLQGLSGCAMEVKAALRHLKQGSSTVGLEQLAVALLHMEKTQASARESIWDLKNAELHNFGLANALSTECHNLCSPALVLNLNILGKPFKFAGDIEKQLYRIGIEAVTNAVRHSGASTIEVSLRYGIDIATLKVRDNGSGFHVPPKATSLSKHWGLTGMQERAKQCSGKLDIISVIANGTEVTLTVPYPWRKRFSDRDISPNPQETP